MRNIFKDISKIVTCHPERSRRVCYSYEDAFFYLRLLDIQQYSEAKKMFWRIVNLKYAGLFLICVFLFSCTQKETKPPKLKEGIWRAQLTIDSARAVYLPFNFEVKHKDTGYVFTIFNGEERIVVDEIAVKNKAIIFQPPVFDSQVIGDFNDEQITAVWLNYARRDKYIIDFFAQHNQAYRFKENCATQKNIEGRWRVMFMAEDGKQTPAVGVFKQSGAKVQGTFLTTTGDYRYLDGCIDADTLMLSCFDGAHAFLFKAIIKNDNVMEGEFWSGIHHYEKWTAEKNDLFHLPSPDSLTYLKEGYDKLSFSFPSLEGDTVSLSDEKYKNKVVIVQVMGSWCPNCKDETEWLAEVHKKYAQQGLEVIALAFERARDNYIAVKNIKRLKTYYHAQYDFLLAGPADKTKAAEALPMLNHIISFPTTIFIDKSGKVRKVHTGFSGPGTGGEYEKFRKETENFLQELLAE